MNNTDLETLEAKGIETVLLEMAQGGHGSPGSPNQSEVEAWIQSKRTAADYLSASKRDAREEETLSIAKEANRIASNAFEEAKRANRSRWKDRTITIIAIIIAAIAARGDIAWLISELIKKFSP
jgi:predicted nucleic acid-binding protein